MAEKTLTDSGKTTTSADSYSSIAPRRLDTRIPDDSSRNVPELHGVEIEKFGVTLSEERDPQNGAAIGFRSQSVLASCNEAAGTGKTVTVSAPPAA